MGYIQTFLNFFQLVSWLAKLDLTTYIVVFYLCIFLVCLVILDIFYVSYSFSRKKFTFVWPLQALRSICPLFVTVLFLPLLGIHFPLNSNLETFTSILACKKKGNMSVHTLFPEFQCWTGLHILHSSFALLVSSLFMMVSIVVALTYYDSQSTSNDPSARVNSRSDVFELILKIILNYLFTFFGFEQYHWFLIAVLLVLSAISYFKYRYSWPYYNEKISKVFNVLTGIFLWTNIVLLIAKILEHTNFNGAL